jgi:polyferredoxin
MSTPLRRYAQAFCFILFLVLFFYYGWPYRSDDNTPNANGFPLIELFLILDPLVAISTAVAAKAMIWSLTAAAIVLLMCIVFPRWFCGYICPMGTLIDLFDWSIGRHIRRFRVTERGWWVNLRFYSLAGILAAAVLGILLSGFVAAIPVLTRGLLYTFAPLQLGLSRGWESVPPMNAGQYISILLFLLVLGLGLLRPRFWCAYLCPSGALLSLASTLSLTRRTVQSTCTQCGQCLRICSFDAIAQDYSTRLLSCASCRSCQTVCPKQSIRFATRWGNPKRNVLVCGS